MLFGRNIELKTPAQLASMREAGLVVDATLRAVREAAEPGMTTADLDAIAERSISDHGATSNFKGYYGFTGVICTSVNDEVVHGIPGPRVLEAGDLLSVDCGAIVDGWHGDAATTFVVGAEPTDEVAGLLAACEDALWAGIAAMWTGRHVGDIGHAIHHEVMRHGDYGVVDGYTGHGIGTRMHMDPSVPNRGRPGRGAKVKPGMVLAIEPMITMVPADTRVLADDWTVVAVDGSVAAHFEHSVALTGDGLWVLTAEDGGEGRLAGLDIPFAPVSA